MKKIIYIKDSPILYTNQRGRNISSDECKVFDDEEINKIYASSLRLEKFIFDWRRGESIRQAYFDLYSSLKGADSPNFSNRVFISRRVRGYILEFDLFLNHWKKYLTEKLNNGGELYQAIVSKMFDTNDSYALICAFRNYLVHSNDLDHHINISFDGVRILVNRDYILSDFNWPEAKRELLKRQNEEIDLIKAIKESFEAIGEIQSAFLDLIITDELKNDCVFLNEMHKKVSLINGKVFYSIEMKDNELGNSKEQGIPLDVGYVEINWDMYNKILNKEKSELLSSLTGK